MNESQETLEDFAKSGILPQRVSETGASNEPLVEVIICDGISGGADYLHKMPAALTLVRRTADGNEFRARYKQQIPDLLPCSCLGSCKGSEGLGQRYYCSLIPTPAQTTD